MYQLPCKSICYWYSSLQWRHNERDGVSNHQPHDSLLNRLFREWSKKTSKLRITCLFERNLPVTGEFPSQRASNAEMFPFDDVIMWFYFCKYCDACSSHHACPGHFDHFYGCCIVLKTQGVFLLSCHVHFVCFRRYLDSFKSYTLI